MEEYVKVKTRKVKYRCDECKLGYMEWNKGGYLASNPPQYVHFCTNCGQRMNSLKKYPSTEIYEE